MAQITTLDSVSKLLKYITITLPPFVTKNEDSYIRQFLSSILEVFKINIDQLNQMFNNTFISEAEDGDLEKLILDVSNVTRKDGETDEDYRNRFYKYVYRYNATANSIEEIVYDTLGYYPIKLTESGARTAYWGLHDLVEEDRVANSAYFYDDVNEYTAYWGRYQSQQSAENEKYFVGIIHLTERPPQEKLDELCDVIERVRKKGTKIYLQFLDNIDIILEPIVTIVEENAFTFTWRLVPSAFSYEIQIDDDPLFGSPTTYITSSISYVFSGLNDGTTYYTRVRYENEDGYSEWTEPVETTTESLIGTPIATEETSVNSSGFTANWGSVSGATSYLLTFSINSDLSSPISGLNELNVGNVVNYAIDSASFPIIESLSTLYYGVKATNGVNTSPYSNIITVDKPIFKNLITTANTRQYLTYQNNLIDQSGNGNTANGVNSSFISGSIIDGDSYYLQTSGVDSYTYTNHSSTLNVTNDLTIEEIFEIDSTTINSLNVLLYKGDNSIPYESSYELQYRGGDSPKRFLAELDDGFNYTNIFFDYDLPSDTIKKVTFTWDNTTKTPKLFVNKTELTAYQDIPLSGGIPYSSIGSIKPTLAYVLRGRYEVTSSVGVGKIKYYRSAIHAEVKSKTISDSDCDTFGLT